MNFRRNRWVWSLNYVTCKKVLKVMNFSSTDCFLREDSMAAEKHHFYQNFCDSRYFQGVRLQKLLLFCNFFAGVSTLLHIVESSLLKFLGVGSICAKFYYISTYFMLWKHSIKLLGWLQKINWSFKFQSLKYTSSSNFRPGNIFF